MDNGSARALRATATQHDRKSVEMTTAAHGTPEARAAQRVKDRTDVMWHVATYLIINGFP